MEEIPQDDFIIKLDEVFTLMLENKLRKDMDDTMLEKLFTVIEKGTDLNKITLQNETTSSSSNEGSVTEKNDKISDFLWKLINKTEAFRLVKQSVLSLLNENEQLSLPVKIFGLRLLGLLLSRRKVFVFHKNSELLCLFSQVCYSKKSTIRASSIQDALLSTLFYIVKHDEGALWFSNVGLLDFVFENFTAPSYFVRCRAVTFITSFVSLWTSSKLLPLNESQKLVLNNETDKILITLVPGVQLYQMGKIFYAKSCVLALKECCKTDHLKSTLCSDFYLIEVIVECLKKFQAADMEIFNFLKDMLLENFSDQPVVETALKDVIKIYVEERRTAFALDFASAFLKECKKYHPMSPLHMAFLLMPLNILSGRVSGVDECVFDINSFEVYQGLLSEMNRKSSFRMVLCATFTGLTRILNFLNPNALNTVASTIGFFVRAEYEEMQFHGWDFSVMENRNVRMMLLNLFNAFLSEEVYVKLGIDGITELIKHALHFLDQPITNMNFICENLKFLSLILKLNAEHDITLSEELNKKIGRMVCHRLVFVEVSVVDSTLSLVKEMIVGMGERWHEIIFDHGIHNIIWNLAFEGNNDSEVISAAINVMGVAFLHKWCLEDIKSTKNITDTDIVKVLGNLINHEDSSVKRESMSSLFIFVREKWGVLPSICKDCLFFVLTNACKNLDLEAKLIALESWQWFLENDCFFPSISFASEIKEYFKFLSNCGCGLSLIIAAQDFDEPVQFKAANILNELRRKLLRLGISKDFNISEDAENGGDIRRKSNDIPVTSGENTDSCSEINISREEREAILDCMMGITTSEHIANISKRYFFQALDIKGLSFSFIKPESIKCSVYSFWNYIWSETIDSYLNDNDKSSDVYSYNSLSLLEDIIAAKENGTENAAKVPDCY